MSVEMEDMEQPYAIIVVDLGLLHLRTDIWNEQLNFLNNYRYKVTFSWMISHDTSTAVKL